MKIIALLSRHGVCFALNIAILLLMLLNASGVLHLLDKATKDNLNCSVIRMKFI